MQAKYPCNNCRNGEVGFIKDTHIEYAICSFCKGTGFVTEKPVKLRTSEPLTTVRISAGNEFYYKGGMK